MAAGDPAERRGRKARQAPCEAISDWPDQVSDAPDVEVARQLALALHSVTQGMSYRAVEAKTGVPYITVRGIIKGLVWPDINTVARLEATLRVDLWPTGVARRLGHRGD